MDNEYLSYNYKAENKTHRFNSNILLFSILLLFLFNLFSLDTVGQVAKRSLVIIVNSDISSGISENLNIFISDLEREDYNVILKVSTYTQPEEVRMYMQNVYNSTNPALIGAILIGNIPLARQFFIMTYANPDILPTEHNGLSTQFYSDLNGTFYKNNPTHPESYSAHDGDVKSEIWVSILPHYSNIETTISKVNQYFVKNHAYRIGNVNLQEGYLEVNEHYNATTEAEYTNFLTFMKSGTYAWHPFTEWGNVGLFINNTLGYPNDTYAYENELQSNKYKFAALIAHGNQNSNGELTISNISSMHISPIFVFLEGCNTGNLDSPENIATEITYNVNNHTLITKGGTSNVGGLGTNENGFYGKNIATAMLSGKSLGEAYLYHNNVPLIYPWSENFEMSYATNIYIGDLSLTLFLIPDQVKLVGPINNSEGVSNNPVLSWNSSPRAKSYRLQVSLTSTFSTTLVDQSNITSMSFALTNLSYNTPYYWRVNATNTTGTSDWSETRKFTTSSGPPSKPTLQIPINNATSIPINPSLTWNTSSGAMTYSLQVSQSASFSPAVVDQSDISGTTFSLSTNLFNNTIYYWRVNAANTNGTSAWSDTWRFTTATLNYPPVAAFSVSSTIINVGQTVIFTDESTNLPTSWNWNFGDGANSTSQSPSHLYSSAGTFTITLTATNSSGSDSEIKTNFIIVNADGILFNPSLTYGRVADFEGNIYKTIQIGTQVWMAENLKITKYNDGNSIPNVTDNSIWSGLNSAAYCWYNNDAPSYKANYGALYNFYAVNTGKLCPTGWHIPSDDDWTILTTYLLDESTAGGKLKETSTNHWVSPNFGATNESGFTALPGGYRDAIGGFGMIGKEGGWWSTLEYDATNVYCTDLRNDYSIVNRYLANKRGAISVRCLQNTIPNLSIAPSPSITVASASGSTGNFNITSNTSWSVSDDAAWLNLSSSSGTGNGTLTVTATSTNTSISQRSANVTFSASGVTSVIVTVTQNGANPTLTVAPQSITVASVSGETDNFYVTSNRSWTVTTDATWLNLSLASGTGNGTLTITTINPNYSTTQRTANVTFSASGVSSVIVTVIQSGGPDVIGDVKNQGINIYPNPVSGILTIEYKDENYKTLNILSSQGVLIAKEKVISPRQQIDFSKYEYGIYILEFVKSLGGIERVKVIKH